MVEKDGQDFLHSMQAPGIRNGADLDPKWIQRLAVWSFENFYLLSIFETELGGSVLFQQDCFEKYHELLFEDLSSPTGTVDWVFEYG